MASSIGGALPTPTVVVLVVIGLGHVLWQRMRGEPLQIKRLLVLPLVFIALGVIDLTAPTAPHLRPADVAVLVAGAVVSVVLGAFRGATVELFPREGNLWQRYRVVTVLLWGVLIALKLLLTLVAHLVGAAAAGNSEGLMLTLGLSLLGEAVLVAPRALSTGAPFASEHSRAYRSLRSWARTHRLARPQSRSESVPG